MKLCSRLFILYCRNCPKDDKFRYLIPILAEVRGGVEPWLMARWKTRVEFLLSVVGLLFLSLTVEALQGKRRPTPPDSRLAAIRRGRSVRAKISGEWVVPGEYFLVSAKLDTFCYRQYKLQRATCRRFDRIPACDGRTDGRTYGRTVRQT